MHHIPQFVGELARRLEGDLMVARLAALCLAALERHSSLDHCGLRQLSILLCVLLWARHHPVRIWAQFEQAAFTRAQANGS
jgi:hypothetical protein